MDTDLQPNAQQPRLTRKVSAYAGVCISVYPIEKSSPTAS